MTDLSKYEPKTLWDMFCDSNLCNGKTSTSIKDDMLIVEEILRRLEDQWRLRKPCSCPRCTGLPNYYPEDDLPEG